MFDLEINHGTRVWHDKAESSGRKWALLSKIEVSRIVDFCHFTKISQLLQGITCSIFKLFTCSWTFWKGL